jgi:hypothetical protein
MQYFHVRYGRRVQIPPIIQLLDGTSPEYRPRLAHAGQERVRAPKSAPDLPGLMQVNNPTRTSQ